MAVSGFSLSLAPFRSFCHAFERELNAFAGKFNQGTLNIIAPKKKQIKDEIERLKNHHLKMM